MCKEVSDKEFKALRESVNGMHEDVAIMSNEIKKLTENTKQLVEVSTKTSIVIERTNENDKKIGILFRKLDEIYEKGTKSCPLNTSKINDILDTLDKQDKFFSKINFFVITEFILFVLAIILLFIKHEL